LTTRVASPVIDAGDGLPLTIPALLRQQARKHGDKTLLVCDDARLSYAELEARSRKLARGLLAHGATKGSHVALLYPNVPDFVIGAMAAARIGAVVVPLSTLSTADELRWLLANSDSLFLLATPEFRSHRYADTLKKALDADFSRPPPLRSATAPWLRRIWFSGPAIAGIDRGWSIDDLEAAGEPIDDAYLEAIEARVSPADRLVIIYTSGSTSAPKGVMHSQGAVLRYVDNVNQVRRYGSDDVVFSPSPWFWIAGWCFALFGVIVAGGRLVTSNSTATSEILDLVERERPNAANGWPPTVERFGADPSFAKRDMSFLKRGIMFGMMSPELRARDPALRHGIYGMSEVMGALTLSGDEADLPESQRGSYGPLLPGFEAKIVDPESGKPCGTGETGELWVRGTFLMEGYYGRPRSELFDADGWWRTSDLGSFDANGFFYFKGRRGNLIKSSGANVAPGEVEAVLRELTGLPCHVFGMPDAQRGQIVAAVVVADRDCDVDLAELKQRLAARLSSYKLPRLLVRRAQSELPLVSSGKLDLRRLIAQLQAG
jgi:acyl-CoA synthetase (AMP-forming)/AMP-acid ligase II